MHPRSKHHEPAKAVIAIVRRQLMFGSNASIDDERSDYCRVHAVRAAVTLAALKVATSGKGKTTFPAMTLINSLSMAQYKYGQCGEISQSAFLELARMGVLPIDFCVTTEGGHNLLVLGRKVGSDPNDISTWGDEAIICDPWINKIYPVHEFKKIQQMKEIGYSSTIPEMTPYLDGSLQIKQSIANSSELAAFMSTVNTISELIKPWFEPEIITHKQLKEQLDKLRIEHDKLRGSLGTYALQSLSFLLDVESNLNQLAASLKKIKKLEKVGVQEVKQEVKKEVQSQLFAKSPHDELFEKIKKLTDKNPTLKSILVPIKNKNYGKALRMACNNAHSYALLDILLDYKKVLNININETAGEMGNAAIHYAIHNENSKILQLLIDKGKPDLSLENSEGLSYNKSLTSSTVQTPKPQD